MDIVHGDGAGTVSPPVATATMGLRTTCFSDTQLKLPSTCTPSLSKPWPLTDTPKAFFSLPMPWPFTDTLKVFFSPVLENDIVSGAKRTIRDLGTSTFALNVQSVGPTFVIVRFTANCVDVSGTVIVG